MDRVVPYQAISICGNRAVEIVVCCAVMEVRSNLQYGTARANALLAGPAFHLLIVKHRWKWVIEMMQQRPPPLVLGRLAKAFFMCGDAVPPHQQQIMALALETPLELMGSVPRRGRYDRLRLSKRGLESLRLPRLYL